MASTSTRLRSWLSGRSEIRSPDLGPRELETLDVLWREPGLSAQEVRRSLSAGEDGVTLNTIQSTLERLHRKNLAQRDKVGRAYRYRASVTRAELISGLLREMSREIGGGDLGAMISGFAGFVAHDDPEIEKKLAELFGQGDRRDD